MIIKHNDAKRRQLEKKGFPNERVMERLNMEMQSLEASDTMKEYSCLPRSSYARVHSLSGNYNGCFAAGLDPRYRLIIFPSITGKDVMLSRECSIIEYIKDYHER